MAALTSSRLGVLGLTCGRTGRNVLQRQSLVGNGLKVGVLSSTNRVANLIATHGEPHPRPKPYPYKTKKYHMFNELFDKTTKRLDENSKVIVVEGNLGLDKASLAQDIAKEFDLLYVPESYFDEIFTMEWSEFDIRELDEQLPEAARAWDLKRFYTDPKAKGSRVGMSQVFRYIKRVYAYTAAIHHMLSTGQGCVMVRSPFSDKVFADTMRKFGYFTKQGLEYYDMIRDNSVCDMLRPHVIVYMDAPVKLVREAINKRNVPHEVHSKVLSDDYLQSINDCYKKNLLPTLNQSGVVINVDMEEGIDMEVLVEDLERLDLDHAPEDYPRRFHDWTKLREDEWAYYRKYYGSEIEIGKLFSRVQPWDAPELMMTDEARVEYERIASSHPGIMYAKGYDPERNSVLFKL